MPADVRARYFQLLTRSSKTVTEVYTIETL